MFMVNKDYQKPQTIFVRRKPVASVTFRPHLFIYLLRRLRQLWTMDSWLKQQHRTIVTPPLLQPLMTKRSVPASTTNKDRTVAPSSFPAGYLPQTSLARTFSPETKALPV